MKIHKFHKHVDEHLNGLQCHVLSSEPISWIKSHISYIYKVCCHDVAWYGLAVVEQKEFWMNIFQRGRLLAKTQVRLD